jgi:hypothetical protein
MFLHFPILNKAYINISLGALIFHSRDFVLESIGLEMRISWGRLGVRSGTFLGNQRIRHPVLIANYP